jgi:hypothetical protein
MRMTGILTISSDMRFSIRLGDVPSTLANNHTKFH